MILFILDPLPGHDEAIGLNSGVAVYMTCYSRILTQRYAGAHLKMAAFENVISTKFPTNSYSSLLLCFFITFFLSIDIDTTL
jgi:hypothetical protein